VDLPSVFGRSVTCSSTLSRITRSKLTRRAREAPRRRPAQVDHRRAPRRAGGRAPALFSSSSIPPQRRRARRRRSAPPRRRSRCRARACRRRRSPGSGAACRCHVEPARVLAYVEVLPGVEVLGAPPAGALGLEQRQVARLHGRGVGPADPGLGGVQDGQWLGFMLLFRLASAAPLALTRRPQGRHPLPQTARERGLQGFCALASSRSMRRSTAGVSPSTSSLRKRRVRIPARASAASR
jgi:hypothetical protein